MDKNKIAGFVKGRISRLSSHNSSWAKAALAKLRRGVGKELGAVPGLFEFVLPENDLTQGKFTENMAEKAVYTSLTLYALHQQANIKCMSTGIDEDIFPDKNSLGNAVKIFLQGNKDDEEALVRRFDKVLTSKDLIELSLHARSIINLLKRDNIPINYPAFAVDLYYFQQYNYRRKVLLKWGRDYYMNRKKEN